MAVKIIIALCMAMTIKAELIVDTSSGLLKGERIYTGFFTSHLAFKGIPFAEPPVGELRFRAPVPHKGWNGVRDATNYGNRCLSHGVFGILSGGDEDCLYLNVYTNDVNGNYPVMVWLYGGAFVLGDGGPFLYGPDYLLKENIVVVTLNYRLTAFGFLSTGDKHAQGNYALKDVLLALKWIKQNIRNFGGDDSKITLAGESAGAVMTHHLSMSHKTEGLFHQAIMMSGNVLMPFSFQYDPLKKAKILARNMGIEHNSTEDLMEKLRAASAHDIIKHTRDILNQDYPFGNIPFDFVISAEPEDSLDERLVIDTPEALMASGSYRQVPMIIGTTSKEGLLAIVKTHFDNSFLEDYNRNPEYLVPFSYNISPNDTGHVIEVARAMRDAYFQGGRLTDQLKDEFAVFQTDTNFLFPADRVLRITAANSSTPIYNYIFSYDGPYNMVKLFLLVKGYSGACHADDIFYLFKPSFPVLGWPWDHAGVVQKRTLSMWGNFIKFGNPTPQTNDLVNTFWPKYTDTEEFYLDIGYDLVVKAHHENMKMLRDFQKKFTDHL